MPFHMNSKKIPFGKSEGVDLFAFDLTASCKFVKTVKSQDWFAVYLELPSTCDLSQIITSLQQDGADFLFIKSDSPDSSKEFWKTNIKTVQIPVFLLDKDNHQPFIDLVAKARSAVPAGKESKKNAEADKIARLTVTFPYEATKNKLSSISLIYSPSNIRSYDYALSLSGVYSVLKDYINFEPFVVVYRLSTTASSRNKNCFGKSGYCAADPDGEGPFNGSDVVLESLREKCIYLESKAKWFEYMEKFNSLCPLKFNLKCSQDVVSKLGMEETKLLACIERSKEANDNSILKKELLKIKEYSDATYPALLLNNVVYQVS